MRDMADCWSEVRDEVARLEELMASIPDDVALGARMLANRNTFGRMPFNVRRALVVVDRARPILAAALERLERVDARLRHGPGNVVGLLPRPNGDDLLAQRQPRRPDDDGRDPPPRAA